MRRLAQYFRKTAIWFFLLATLVLLVNCQGVSTGPPGTETGGGASTHTVSLSWNKSTSPDIAGYDIYRSVFTTACGPYGRISSQLNTSTTYTDSNVVNGTSYCYAVKAVNTSNQQSDYSNIVSDVKIPPT